MSHNILEDTEFHYTPKEKVKMQKLRKIIEECPDLFIGVEDVFLSKFLSHTKWDVQKGFAAIRRYYNFKYEHPEWMASHNIEYFRKYFVNVQGNILMPQRDINGRAIAIFKVEDAFDKYENYFFDTVEMHDLIFESLLLLPQVQKHGLTLIYDLSGTSRNLIRWLSPTYCRLANTKNEVIPVTERKIHLIQRGFLMHALLALLWPFISKEIKERITLHDGKNFDKLHTMVGAENLPEEYGGPSGVKCDSNLTFDHLLRHAKYLEQIQRYRKYE